MFLPHSLVLYTYLVPGNYPTYYSKLTLLARLAPSFLPTRRIYYLSTHPPRLPPYTRSPQHSCLLYSPPHTYTGYLSPPLPLTRSAMRLTLPPPSYTPAESHTPPHPLRSLTRDMFPAPTPHPPSAALVPPPNELKKTLDTYY